MAGRIRFLSFLSSVLVIGGLVIATVFQRSKTAVAQAEPDGADVVRLAKRVDQSITDAAVQSIERGRATFRFDTFGDESFWGDLLHLDDAIAGAANGGVGPGLSPNRALALGLKVDIAAIPQPVQNQLRRGEINLDDPATTLALLRLDAVVGVKGFFNGAGLASIGIQCALCHSTVDNSLAVGIGNRLDGWANRDLDIGAIVASAPDLSPFATLLGVSQETVRQVLNSWGPGKFDAELVLDGKAFQDPPANTKSAATLIPPAFGLAGWLST
jgi:hypothetical protein